MTRKPRLQRLSLLFTIEVHFPKLDAEGSNPFSRSIFSMTYEKSRSERRRLFKVTGYI